MSCWKCMVLHLKDILRSLSCWDACEEDWDWIFECLLQNRIAKANTDHVKRIIWIWSFWAFKKRAAATNDGINHKHLNASFLFSALKYQKDFNVNGLKCLTWASEVVIWEDCKTERLPVCDASFPQCLRTFPLVLAFLLWSHVVHQLALLHHPSYLRQLLQETLLLIGRHPLHPAARNQTTLNIVHALTLERFTVFEWLKF